MRARIAEEQRDPAAALAALAALAAHAPDLPGLRRRMLEQAVEAGDLVAARQAARQLWDAGDGNFDAQIVLLVDAMRRSDWADARRYLDGRTDKGGGDVVNRLIGPSVAAWIDLGARERHPERHLLAASADETRVEPALALEGALVALAARRPEDAVRIADGTVLTDRTSQLVALRLAASLESRGMDAAAERLRKRIALAAGEREDPMLLLPDQPVDSPRAGAAFWLALLADGLARTPNANPKYPLLFARAAHWLDDRDWTVRAALVEALAANDQKADARALTEKLRGPLPAPLAMRRAELMADAGEMKAAVALADSAANGATRARGLFIRFADIARRAEDADAAARAYRGIETTLEDSESDSALRATLLVAEAELLLEAGDWGAAQPLLERAVALRPTDPQILNYAGYSALERRDNIEQSLARIEAAWAREPGNAAITDSLGWAYFLTGRVDEAVELLEKAQQGEPTNAVIVEHLGDAYWQAGRRFQARYVWRAAALLADAEAATRIEAKLRDGLTPATVAP